MEAAAIFTVAALRGLRAACLLTVSDLVDGRHTERISDDALETAVTAMAELALRAATSAKR